MKVAVIGAGFSGLSLAYQLKEFGVDEIVVFDGNGIGNGASGVAAGLLHPYAGAASKKNINGDDAMEATLRLMKIAEKASGRPVYEKSGLLRLASTPEQEENFQKCTDIYSDVKWMTAKECAAAVDGAALLPGIFIESGYIVDCRAYLDGLWEACSNMGITFEKKNITDLGELERFDNIVVAAGAASAGFKELSHIRVTPVKGQVLEIDWPKDSSPLPFPLSSQAYLLKAPGTGKAIGGATFEHHFTTTEPLIDEAIKEILPKLQVFYPSIDPASITGCRAGVRASTAGHRPLGAKVTDRVWLLTGMGSKGLLYHALYSAGLARQIVSSA